MKGLEPGCGGQGIASAERPGWRGLFSDGTSGLSWQGVRDCWVGSLGKCPEAAEPGAPGLGWCCLEGAELRAGSPQCALSGRSGVSKADCAPAALGKLPLPVGKSSSDPNQSDSLSGRWTWALGEGSVVSEPFRTPIVTVLGCQGGMGRGGPSRGWGEGISMWLEEQNTQGA